MGKNPIYVAEMRGSAEMLFHLGGHRAAGKVRTIGAAETVSRLRTLQILPTDGQLDLLIDLRKGVAHSTGGEHGRALLATLAKSVQALHVGLATPLASFWGRWDSAVRIALDHQRDQTEREVQSESGKLEIASLTALATFRLTSWKVCAPHSGAVRANGSLPGYTRRPASLGPLWVGFRAQPVEINALIVLAAQDEEPDMHGGFLGCALCGLRLEGTVELQAAEPSLPEGSV
ncbi:hypothetical protein ADK94_01055 [Streptomyces sp. XY593]|nr:hypothetical protein ADK94_01055 [Streptomyces sp. XY593]